MTPFTGVPLSKAAQFVGIQQDYTQSEDRLGRCRSCKVGASCTTPPTTI